MDHVESSHRDGGGLIACSHMPSASCKGAKERRRGTGAEGALMACRRGTDGIGGTAGTRVAHVWHTQPAKPQHRGTHLGGNAVDLIFEERDILGQLRGISRNTGQPTTAITTVATATATEPAPTQHNTIPTCNTTH